MILLEYHIAMIDFFYRYSKCRRKTIDLIFKVLKPEVKNAFISVIEWPRIPAWYLKLLMGMTTRPDLPINASAFVFNVFLFKYSVANGLVHKRSTKEMIRKQMVWVMTLAPNIATMNARRAPVANQIVVKPSVIDSIIKNKTTNKSHARIMKTPPILLISYM